VPFSVSGRPDTCTPVVDPLTPSKERVRLRPSAKEQAMVRERVVQTVKYGYFRQALEILTELNRVCGEKGLRPFTLWAPVAGVNNELIIETEYASLADFEHESAAFYGDADTMKVWRSAAEYIIEGSGRTELFETAPTLA
jgi:hypothetical protein